MEITLHLDQTAAKTTFLLGLFGCELDRLGRSDELLGRTVDGTGRGDLSVSAAGRTRVARSSALLGLDDLLLLWRRSDGVGLGLGRSELWVVVVGFLERCEEGVDGVGLEKANTNLASA